MEIDYSLFEDQKEINKENYNSNDYKQKKNIKIFILSILIILGFIILYTNIKDVEDHSDKASLGFFNCKFQFAFMMRVNTNKIRKPDIFPEKWILNGNYEEIRPYRLLIKII